MIVIVIFSTLALISVVIIYESGVREKEKQIQSLKEKQVQMIEDWTKEKEVMIDEYKKLKDIYNKTVKDYHGF